MKPTKTILIGAPLSGEEARFLRRLYADLDDTKALILANFDTDRRQIDFVVVTPVYAALLELKNFAQPIFGQQNGIWTYFGSAGVRLRYSGENPWHQAKEAKFALSDEMLKFQKRHGDVPAPAGRGYFTQFAAFVCIYPQIHADSQVTRGDHKVAVASYPEVLDAIRSDSISSTWSLEDWRRFAEQHLSLTESTLEGATDRRVNEAAEKIRTYRERLETVIGTALPPLFSTPDNVSQGQGLIDALLDGRNFLLLGPSGSTKTFHLHHLALAISIKGEEVPLLLEAKRYRGSDFWTLLRHGTAPLFLGDPRELLDAMRLCGLRPALMIDALNECAERYKRDLIRGVQSFVLQYGARVVFTSQEPLELPGDIAAVSKHVTLPDSLHKRAIYAYHAGVSAAPEIDYLCSGFTNAYDLTIAGRCHSSAVGPESRTDLYDRYVYRCLPEHTAVASAILRKAAAEMANTFSSVWSRDAFERFAEQFLAEQEAPLTILDELRNSRLIHITDDSFSFEHELLVDYFKAENLRRSFSDVPRLAEELKRPRNQGLLDFVLPRFSDPTAIATLVSVADGAPVLCRVIGGHCGRLPQSLILQQCEELLEAATQDLSNIQAICQTIRTEDGRRRFAGLELEGNRAWTQYERLLCDVIALNLDRPALQLKFLELLNLTEWTLRAAVYKAAEGSRYKPELIWGEAVRLYGGIPQFGTMKVPCSTILATMRHAQMFPRHYKQGLPLCRDLLERVRRTPASHFSMLTLFENLHDGNGAGDIGMNLNLVQQGWNTGIYILRISALELLQSMCRQIHETATEVLPRVREMLGSFETDDILVNSALLEALACYGGLDLPVSLETAVSEMKSVITPNATTDEGVIQIAELCEVSPGQYIADQAYSHLSRIFEDVFQGVYFDAYSELSEEEKGNILCLAAKATKPGFHTGWILRELFQHARENGLPVYEHFAMGVDRESFSPQESVAAFALGVEGCARWGGALPPYQQDQTPEKRAWQTVGEILLLVLRGDLRPELLNQLWARFTGPVALSAADVFYQLNHSQWRVGDRLGAVDLVVTFAQEVRPILEHCLEHREQLPSIFRHGGSRDPSVIRFLIHSLSAIGDSKSLPKLTALADDTKFGRDALSAIVALQKRLIS